MKVRLADKNDIGSIMGLLYQVLEVHAKGRPDLFKANTAKYTEEELYYIITNPLTPVFAAVDEKETVVGHCFCKLIRHSKDNVLTDIKTLYIDDLCIDRNYRGRHIGKALYNYVLNFARKEGCYNVTLNVWGFNKSAIEFYQSMGMEIQKIGMEEIL